MSDRTCWHKIEVWEKGIHAKEPWALAMLLEYVTELFNLNLLTSKWCYPDRSMVTHVLAQLSGANGPSWDALHEIAEKLPESAYPDPETDDGYEFRQRALASEQFFATR